MRCMTFAEWLRLLPYANYDNDIDFGKLTRPESVGGHEVMKNLNVITFGQLCQLQELKKVEDMFIGVPKILLNMTTEEVMRSDATDVVRLSAWVAREVKRISDLFGKLNKKPTAEEQQAGIEEMKFGMFGIVDWYAQRMHIADHEQVMSIAWVRIYECMRMDNIKAQFMERLNKIYNEKMKRK